MTMPKVYCLWRLCDGTRLLQWQSAPRNKETLMVGPRGLMCTTTTPPPAPHPPVPTHTHTPLDPRQPSAHQSRDRHRRKGWTSSPLSKSVVTLLLRAAFTAPDTKFKVISPQCVCVCLWGESKLGVCSECSVCVCFCMHVVVFLCVSRVCVHAHV